MNEEAGRRQLGQPIKSSIRPETPRPNGQVVTFTDDPNAGVGIAIPAAIRAAEHDLAKEDV